MGHPNAGFDHFLEQVDEIGLFNRRRFAEGPAGVFRSRLMIMLAELGRARKAMDQQEAGKIVSLERDPATGVYSPKVR